eukprot:COSAG04_NODE_17_length_40288_cov_9.152728_18_plen_233_part_00
MLLALAMASSAASGAAPPLVDCTYEPRRCQPVAARTTLGALQGLVGGGVASFKGVPFAEPPRLFAPAELKKPWASVLNATAYGAKCMQTGVMADAGPFAAQPDASGSAVLGSADCLSLNIWTPSSALPSDDDSAPPAKLLPVLVYIHGGGFNIGSAHSCEPPPPPPPACPPPCALSPAAGGAQTARRTTWPTTAPPSPARASSSSRSSTASAPWASSATRTSRPAPTLRQVA